RLRGRFKGSNKRDEIGDLARALERLSRRLEQHQQSTEAFASDVSHEFKNPLASIRMATEMLAQVDAPAERSRFLRVAESEIARMENLLSQVREITTMDAEIQKEEPTTLDVNLGRIFDRFFTYRPDHPTTQRHTGLGLSIVKAIVEGYGGTVAAANRPGGGAVFEVRLP